MVHHYVYEETPKSYHMLNPNKPLCRWSPNSKATLGSGRLSFGLFIQFCHRTLVPTMLSLIYAIDILTLCFPKLTITVIVLVAVPVRGRALPINTTVFPFQLHRRHIASPRRDLFHIYNFDRGSGLWLGNLFAQVDLTDGAIYPHVIAGGTADNGNTYHSSTGMRPCLVSLDHGALSGWRG